MNNEIMNWVKAIGVIFVIYILLSLLASSFAVGSLGGAMFWFGYAYGVLVAMVFRAFLGD